MKGILPIGSARLWLPSALLLITFLLGAIAADQCLAARSARGTPLMTGIDFVDGAHGWACGGNCILRTTDGGATWRRPVRIPGYISFGDIGFWDRSHGIAADVHGTTWQTSNGGRTWLQRDAREGYAEHATLELLGTKTAWQTLSFVEEDRGYSSSSSSRTTDRGETWTVWPPNVIAGTEGACTWTDLALAPGDRLWRAGVRFFDLGYDGDGAPIGLNVAQLASTSDNGATWPVQLGPEELGFAAAGLDTGRRSHLWAIEFKGLRGWAVGDYGARTSRALMVRTTDGGLTWSARRFDRFWGFTHISMATAKVGWVTADEGDSAKPYLMARNRILKTTDGGRSWTVQYLPKGLCAVDVDAVTGTTAYAAGFRRDVGDYILHGGMVAKTTDGGAHWTRVW